MGTYRNAIELLVEEEVDRQISKLPSRTASYTNRTELIAYALNQLPPLYATSEKGLEYQIQKARTQLSSQINQAVMRAFAAIRRDPIRTCAPLKTNHLAAPLEDVLRQLRSLLKNDKVDWDNLPTAVEKALNRATQSGITWDARYQVPNSSNRRSDAGSTPSMPWSERNQSSNSYRSGNPATYRRRYFSNEQPVSSGTTDKPSASVDGVSSSSINSESDQSTSYGWDDPLYK